MVINSENWYQAKYIINCHFRDRFQLSVRDEYVDSFSRWVAFRGCSEKDLWLLMSVASEMYDQFPTIAQFSKLLDNLPKVKPLLNLE